MKFGERLKELREEKGLNISQLSRAIGVSHVTIIFWESNKKVPTLYNAAEVAKYFNVSLDYLAGLED